MKKLNTRVRRPLRPGQLESLQKFARLEITLDELAQHLGPLLEHDFGTSERRLAWHYILPDPHIRIEMSHIRNAMDKHSRGEITTERLSDWAALLLLNEAYDWEGPDEEEIAEWLNEISLLTLKPKPHAPE